MSQKRGRPRKGESRRRWRIPPPLLRDAGDPGPEGLQILHELPGALGGLLWKTLRSVILWAEVPPADREGLFEAGAAERRRAEILTSLPDGEEELASLLETLARILSHPTSTDADVVGLACLRVAEWARQAEHPRTALEFLQAGALACPADPRFALAIVRAARDLAQYSRAEAWFFRAVGLARQCRDWDSYVRAYLAHARMMLRRGSIPAARRSVLKALRRSNRQGLAETRAMALHDLFVIEDLSGNPDVAQRHALDALSAYGPDHPQAPLLAHDLACFWLHGGRFVDALQVVREVTPLIPRHLRPVALGTLARAAGGAGEERDYVGARAQLSRHADGPGVAEAWVEVARGAVQLGRLQEAEAAVRRAEQLARERHEGRVRLLAEAVADSIRAEMRAAAARGRSAALAATAPAMPSQESVEVVRILRERVVGAPSPA